MPLPDPNLPPPHASRQDIPPAPAGWELEGAQDPAQEQEEEQVRELSLPGFPLAVLRLARPWRRGTPRAREEWLAYYQGRYVSRDPDVSLFCRLLARNGFWDIPSPFVPGSRQAAEFCQSGVMLADVVFLLDRWASHVMERGYGFFDIGPTDALSGDDALNPYLHNHIGVPSSEGDAPATVSTSQDSFSPIHQHIAMESRAQACRQHFQAFSAARCLVSLFLDARAQWDWLSEKMHNDNRILLCKIVYDAAQPVERSHLVQAWVDANWMSKAAADRLAGQALLAENH